MNLTTERRVIAFESLRMSDVDAVGAKMPPWAK